MFVNRNFSCFYCYYGHRYTFYLLNVCLNIPFDRVFWLLGELRYCEPFTNGQHAYTTDSPYHHFSGLCLTAFC